jgi:membrane-anchored glycerophosphoryl diester phosphodiesterase (GDPDase)
MTFADHALEPPSATGVYQRSWPTLRKYFVELLVITVLWGILSLPSGFSDGWFAQFVVTAYQVLVLGPLSFGGLYAMLTATRDRRPEVGLLFVAFQRCYWPSVLANFLLSVALMVGFAMLILPGIFLAVRLAFVPYLVVDEDLDPVAAFRESWRRTAPVGWTLFGAMLLAIPIALGGLLLLVVGVVPALVWTSLAFARLFVEATELDRRRPVIELGRQP